MAQRGLTWFNAGMSKMAKKTKYRQCVLKKDNATQVSYLPEKYAHMDNVVKLKNNGEWDNGWKVIYAGELTDEPADVHQRIKAHRKATGDSLPKTPPTRSDKP